jgi:hypothetical protein
MKFVVLNLNKKKLLDGTFVFVIILSAVFVYWNLHQAHSTTDRLIMGGQFYKQESKQFDEIEVSKVSTEKREGEKYFRPSKLPILNDRKFKSDFFHEFYKKKTSEITLPNELLQTPEDTIINYFSILKHAANHQEGKSAGCGTLGYSRTPYPVAYNFLTSTYQEQLDYDSYLKSFENILHINLIKVKRVPGDEKHPNDMRYFVEIETIEGSEKDVAYFAYYYGYIYISKEESQYKISDIQFHGENYLCAPYHGWSYIAEAVVDIKYGDWCSLVKERYPTQQEGYVKNIYFKGTDGNDYLFVFFQLTNDTDIEIAQYKKTAEGKWELIRLDPEKCLDNK